MKILLLFITIITSCWGAFDASDERHQLVTRVRTEFASEISARKSLLKTSYDAVALLDIAREKLPETDTNWESVIKLVSCGWGFKTGVNSSLKATPTDVEIMRRSISARALHLRYQGYVDPVKVEDVFTLARTMRTDTHVKIVNEASLDDYHVPSKKAEDTIGISLAWATKLTAPEDKKFDQVFLKFEGGKWSFRVSSWFDEHILWTQGSSSSETFIGELNDPRGRHLFSFKVNENTAIIQAISTGYPFDVQGNGAAFKVADGDKLGIVESSAENTAITFRSDAYRGDRAILLAHRGNINIQAGSIRTRYKSKFYQAPQKYKIPLTLAELMKPRGLERFSAMVLNAAEKESLLRSFWSRLNAELPIQVKQDQWDDAGYETRTENGGEYKFFPQQEQFMEAKRDIYLDGDYIDVSLTTIRAGKDLFLGKRERLFGAKFGLVYPNSVLHTHGSVLFGEKKLTICAHKWDGQTSTEYVGSAINQGNGWTGQTLVPTCNRGSINVGMGGEFTYDVDTLYFLDDAERLLMTSRGVGTYTTFVPRPLQALTPPPRQEPRRMTQREVNEVMLRGYGIGWNESSMFQASGSGPTPAAPGILDMIGELIASAKPMPTPDRINCFPSAVPIAIGALSSSYKVYKRLAGAAKTGKKIATAARTAMGMEPDSDSEDDQPKLEENAGGHIRSFVTDKTETYYRVYSERDAGFFLTKVRPKSSALAREGLALPPANKASFVQEVIVPAGTKLQRSRAIPVPAFGKTRGGMEQFEIIAPPGTNPHTLATFKPGVPLP